MVQKLQQSESGTSAGVRSALTSLPHLLSPLSLSTSDLAARRLYSAMTLPHHLLLHLDHPLTSYF